MVLYQTISTYQLLNAITHKLSVNKDEDCVLIISKWLVQKFPHYEDLNEFFKKVIVMDPEMALSDKYHENNKAYCEKLLKDNGFCIEDFSEIHVMGYHYNFGAYLSHNNIKHNFWEDAAGLLSKPEILIEINRKGFPQLCEFCEKEHLYDGTAEGIEKRYCNYNAQKADFPLEDTVDFDVIKSYLSLDEDLKKQVLAFFCDIDKIDTDENSVLILTQQLFSLNVMSFEHQALIYQLLVDYFFEDASLVFKPHPDDYMFYGILFPDSRIIREKFPAEFLPGLFTNKPRKIATISSTAIENLKAYFDEVFYLGPRFEKEFKSTHKYKVAYEFKNVQFSSYKLNSIGVNENYEKAFNVSDNTESAKTFHIIDKLSSQEEYKYNDIVDLLENSSEDDVFVFINSAKDFCFYDIERKNVWNNLVPIVISKKQVRDSEFYEDEENEMIFVYSKSETILNIARNFKFNKTLSCTGLEISTKIFDDDECHILILEAILAATESRLLAYESLSANKNQSLDITPIDENKVSEIRYSDPALQIEDIDANQNKMRILEAIIRSTEQRLIFCTIPQE